MSRAQWRPFVALTLAVISVDLASKAWASRALADHGRNLPGPLDLRLGHNAGIAFGLLTDLPPAVLVLSTCFVAAGLIVAVARGSVSWLPTALVLGGALGNVIDRIHDSTVVDMLDTTFWPTFNLADIAITCGVALWIAAPLWRPPSPSEIMDKPGR